MGCWTPSTLPTMEEGGEEGALQVNMGRMENRGEGREEP